MGRPGLALGTAGKVRTHPTPSGHRAVAWYRDYDGRCRQVERHFKTKAAAEAALRLALRDRAQLDVDGEITPTTRVEALAEAWFAGLKNLSPTTKQAYRNRLDQQILPGLGTSGCESSAWAPSSGTCVSSPRSTVLPWPR